MKEGLLESRALDSDRAALCLSGKPTGDRLPTFVAEPNAPRVTAIEKISVERADDAWTARVDLDLDISGGDVAALRFEVPPQWNRPTQIVPEMPLDIVDIPGESRRQMVLRPRVPSAAPGDLASRGRSLAAVSGCGCPTFGRSVSARFAASCCCRPTPTNSSWFGKPVV